MSMRIDVQIFIGVFEASDILVLVSGFNLAGKSG